VVSDFAFIGVTLIFFGLSWAFVELCDRL